MSNNFVQFKEDIELDDTIHCFANKRYDIIRRFENSFWLIDDTGAYLEIEDNDLNIIQ